MKKACFLVILAVMAVYACSTEPQSVVDKALHVYGNCEKCKARIENASKIKGVSHQNWNIDSKLLSCKIDTVITSVDELLKIIAKAGHDNELYPADDYVYDKLPVTCQYERVEHN